MITSVLIACNTSLAAANPSDCRHSAAVAVTSPSFLHSLGSCQFCLPGLRSHWVFFILEKVWVANLPAESGSTKILFLKASGRLCSRQDILPDLGFVCSGPGGVGCRKGAVIHPASGAQPPLPRAELSWAAITGDTALPSREGMQCFPGPFATQAKDVFSNGNRAK